MRKPEWKLNRTVQCAKCPWRVDVDPNEIPNGYSFDKHVALNSTIAKDGDYSGLTSPEIHIMACHEMHNTHCIGWLMNQLGVGNNIALRLHMMRCENAGSLKTIGEQHQRFQDTLPEHP